MAVSEDGVNWVMKRDYDWGAYDMMVTEEHFTYYYNRYFIWKLHLFG